MLDRIWIWFADNGNIRKWQREPFDEGTEFVALSTVTPAEVGGLVERLRSRIPANGPLADVYYDVNEAASLIQSQAARIAELEAGLEAIAVFLNPPTVSQARARAMLNKDSSHD
ncbi:MAG: hypothetical protein M9945_07635 [Aquamicrobium sp.]|uniref:hypothetical protein n=1 Tax=Aquamicrobium sp. TaxID=1872579 RepID=UPI00349E669E|nr:hypothetical protein [Aquamicrobium sp.]